MSYINVSLRQTNDYIAIKTDTGKTDPFAIALTGIFGGATVSLIRAFTNAQGEMDLLNQAPLTDGNSTDIVYTKIGAFSISAILPDNWYIFKLNNASGSTNVSVNIDGIRQTIEDSVFLKQNIITNNLAVQIL